MAIEGYFSQSAEWAIILGGSSGIGLATALKLGEEGLNLLILHRDRKNGVARLNHQLEPLRKQGRKIKTLNMDATQDNAINKSIQVLRDAEDQRGCVKLLLHSISRGNLKPLSQLTRADMDQTIRSMGTSLHDWFKAFYNNKLFADKARVIGLTSEGASRAVDSYAAIAAAKAGMEAICRSIAVEFGSEGIRSNVLQPGVCDTASLRMIPGYEQIVERSKERNPVRRLTTPEDVANIVYLLCRKEADWINGAIIPVDGGESIVT